MPRLTYAALLLLPAVAWSEPAAACSTCGTPTSPPPQTQQQAQGQAQRQGQSQAATATLSGNSSQAAANVSNTVLAAPATGRLPAYAPSVYAPPLVTSNDTCMGSTTLGGSGAPFSFLFGTSWTSDPCETRAVATQAARLGDPGLAAEIMCEDHKYRAARLRLGQPCTQDRPAAAVPAAAPQPVRAGLVSDLRPSAADCAAFRTIHTGWTEEQAAYYDLGCPNGR